MIDEANGQYTVKSQSHAKMDYGINMIAYTCTCLDYPAIRFCKHICTVKNHYPSVHPFIDLDQDPQESLLIMYLLRRLLPQVQQYLYHPSL